MLVVTRIALVIMNFCVIYLLLVLLIVSFLCSRKHVVDYKNNSTKSSHKLISFIILNVFDAVCV